MKILYVGTERADAQAVAGAVSALSENVKVSWTSELDDVVMWIGRSGTPRAIVVDARPNGSVWRSVLKYTAGLAAPVPVVVIVPEGTTAHPQPGQECIVRNPSLLRDLPAVVSRAIDRVQRGGQQAQRAGNSPKPVMLAEFERAARADLERKLLQATTRIQQAERRHQSAMETAAEQLAAAEAQHELAMARAAAMRDMVDEQFRAASLEIESIRRAHASAVADAERLARREAELAELLGTATATREVLERRLAETETALQAAETRAAAERQTVAELMAANQREFQRRISEENERRRSVEEALANALSASEAASARHASAIGAMTARCHELDAALSAARQDLESTTARVDALAAREVELGALLAAATAAADGVRHQHESVVADVARLTAREADLRSELAAQQARFDRDQARADAERTGVLAALRAAERARDEFRREHRSTLAEVARLTEREVSLDAQLEEERAARAGLEQALADSRASLLDEQERHEAALATSAVELAERQAQFDDERTRAAADRAAISAQLRDVEQAFGEARHEHQTVVATLARLTEREVSLVGQLEEERVTRRDLEQAIADAQAALKDEQQRHESGLAAAAGKLLAQQAQFDRERARADAERTSVLTQLREAEKARDESRREHRSTRAEVARLTEREASLEGQLEEERATRAALEQALADSRAVLRDEQERFEATLATSAVELAQRQAQFDEELSRAAAELTSVAAQLREVEGARDQARGEHQSALADLARLTERASAERTAAAACQADLELRLSAGNEEINALRAAALVQAALVADQFEAQRRQHESRLADAQDINNMLARERAALQESLHATQEESHRLDREHRAERERLEEALAAANAEIQRITAERQAVERRLEDAGIAFQETLDGLTADHAAALVTRERDIEQLRADHRRLFQRAPVPLFRCTTNGALTDANRMLTDLVGRSSDELRGTGFAAAVFESPNDLSWLIERCQNARGSESTETTWRRKDGSRLLVRVSATATSSDLIDCGVEDLTPVRVLQDRLSQAHRMEAVGRLAAEVAVTCGNLLRGIQQNTQQWLLTEGAAAASRQRGDMLLEELSRAAGLLRQLAVYGDEESRRPAVVELSTVVRDMALVLKRVAGDAVDVQLPSASARLNVDAGADRIQRLLVNLAAYGRDRMPFGGRLTIELGTIVVDRRFTAKHPNVRLGPHALITVTESRRAARTRGPLQLHDHEPAGSPKGSVAVQTSVDLGTLQEIVGECGGHLWMTVQPMGDMVVKIWLPLRTSYGEPARRPLASGVGPRTIAQWFQH
jgi:PAS domain S-box-containing protein